MVYVPAGVLASTVTVPLVFTVSGPVLEDVICTSVVVGVLPFNLSLLRTLIPASPPFNPITGPAISLNALIGRAVIVKVASVLVTV